MMGNGEWGMGRSKPWFPATIQYRANKKCDKKLWMRLIVVYLPPK